MEREQLAALLESVFKRMVEANKDNSKDHMDFDGANR